MGENTSIFSLGTWTSALFSYEMKGLDKKPKDLGAREIIQLAGHLLAHSLPGSIPGILYGPTM